MRIRPRLRCEDPLPNTVQLVHGRSLMAEVGKPAEVKKSANDDRLYRYTTTRAVL